MADPQQKLVQVPDLGVVAFPGDMPDEQIASHIKKHKAKTPPDHLKQASKEFLDSTSAAPPVLTTEESERARQLHPARPFYTPQQLAEVNKLSRIEPIDRRDSLPKKAATFVGDIGGGALGVVLHPVQSVGGIVSSVLPWTPTPNPIQSLYQGLNTRPAETIASGIGQAAVFDAAFHLPEVAGGAYDAIKSPLAQHIWADIKKLHQDESGFIELPGTGGATTKVKYQDVLAEVADNTQRLVGLRARLSHSTPEQIAALQQAVEETGRQYAESGNVEAAKRVAREDIALGQLLEDAFQRSGEYPKRLGARATKGKLRAGASTGAPGGVTRGAAVPGAVPIDVPNVAAIMRELRQAARQRAKTGNPPLVDPQWVQQTVGAILAPLVVVHPSPPSEEPESEEVPPAAPQTVPARPLSLAEIQRVKQQAAALNPVKNGVSVIPNLRPTVPGTKSAVVPRGTMTPVPVEANQQLRPESRQILVQANFPPVKEDAPKWKQASQNPNIAKQFARLGIPGFSIDAPYKFGLSEQGNIDPATGQIQISAAASDPEHTLAHELAHDIYLRLSPQNKSVIDMYVQNSTAYREHAGGLEERVSDHFADALLGRDYPPVAISKIFFESPLQNRPAVPQLPTTPLPKPVQPADGRTWSEIAKYSGGNLRQGDDIEGIVKADGDFPLVVKDITGARHVAPASVVAQILKDPIADGYVDSIFMAKDHLAEDSDQKLQKDIITIQKMLAARRFLGQGQEPDGPPMNEQKAAEWLEKLKVLKAEEQKRATPGYKYRPVPHWDIDELRITQGGSRPLIRALETANNARKLQAPAVPTPESRQEYRSPQVMPGGGHPEAIKSAMAEMFPIAFGGAYTPAPGSAGEFLAKEAKPTKYKYGNTQADVPADSEAGQALAAARAQIDPNDLMASSNTSSGGGLEDQAHITVRYGIDGEDHEGIKKYLESQAPFEATLGKTTAFPPSKHSDGAAPIVVSIESPDLRRMEKEIDAHGDFIERTFPDYRPHVTLAYTRPEAAHKYVGMDQMKGKTFTVDEVSISHKDGSLEKIKLRGGSSHASSGSSGGSGTSSTGARNSDTSIAPDIGGASTSPPKSVVNSVITDTHQLADFLQSPAFKDHGFNGLDVPSQRVVMSNMIAALHQLEIRNRVIQFVPVDVVNNLVSLHDPPNVFLHDQDVLANGIITNGKHSVSISTDIANSLASAIAEVVTKLPRRPLESARRTVESGTTISTGNIHDDSNIDITPTSVNGNVKPVDPEASLKYKAADQGQPFYLKSERILADKMRGPMPAPDIQKMLLANGVKPEEMKWTGLDDFLWENWDKKVTPEQIKEFIDTHDLQIEEVMKGAKHVFPPKEVQDAAIARLENAKQVLVSDHARSIMGTPEYDRIVQEYKDAESAMRLTVPGWGIAPSGETTKYGSYTMPGAEPGSYRELLVTLPAKPLYEPSLTELPQGYKTRRGSDVPAMPEWGELGQPKQSWEVVDENGLVIADGATEEEAKAKALRTVNYGRRREAEDNRRRDSSIYQTPHWENNPNVLGHIRFNERSGPNGERILHVDELQSDWHQRGRDVGYEDAERKALNEKVRELTRQIQKSQAGEIYTPEAKEETKRLWEERRKLQEGIKGEGVPDAPFRKTWHEMLLKRVLKYAVDNGFDGVAWTPGAEQAERYDLSKQVSELRYRDKGNGTYEIDAYLQEGGKQTLGDSIPADKLSDYVGKEVAQKIIGGEGEPSPAGKKRLVGEDLKVGGYGMKGFYDKIIPDAANKLGKKFGTKVGETTIQTGEPDSGEGWGRASVWETIEHDNRLGQMPLYATFDSGGNFTGVSGLSEDIFIGETKVKVADEHGNLLKAAKLPGKAKTVPYLPITPEMRAAGPESLFHLVYKSPAAKPDHIAEARADLAKVEAELDKNPPPLEPIDATTPEALEAWKTRHKAWLKKAQPLLNRHNVLTDRVNRLENQNIGQIRELPEGQKILWLKRAGLRGLHLGFGGDIDVDRYELGGVSISAEHVDTILNNLDVRRPLFFNEIKSMLEKARDEKGRVIVAAIPAKGESVQEALARLREELNHGWQKDVVDAVGNHLPAEKFKELNDAIPEPMRDYLATNYPELADNDGSEWSNKKRVLEASAKMVSDSPATFGLSEYEWAGFLFEYFSAVEAEHGAQAFDRLTHVTTRARQVKEDYFNARGRGQGSAETQGSMGGVQRGDEGSGGFGEETQRGEPQGAESAATGARAESLASQKAQSPESGQGAVGTTLEELKKRAAELDPRNVDPETSQKKQKPITKGGWYTADGRYIENEKRGQHLETAVKHGLGANGYTDAWKNGNIRVNDFDVNKWGLDVGKNDAATRERLIEAIRLLPEETQSVVVNYSDYKEGTIHIWNAFTGQSAKIEAEDWVDKGMKKQVAPVSPEMVQKKARPSMVMGGWFTVDGEFLPNVDLYQHGQTARKAGLGISYNEVLGKGHIRLEHNGKDWGLEAHHVDKAETRERIVKAIKALPEYVQNLRVEGSKGPNNYVNEYFEGPSAKIEAEDWVDRGMTKGGRLKAVDAWMNLRKLKEQAAALDPHKQRELESVK